jgi:hypothetical protein
MKKWIEKALIGSFVLSGFVTAPAWSQNQNARPARVGGINYVEGEASIETRTLTPDSVGSVALEKDQTLTTQTGKVEMLLTPGVFLRLADNSQIKMVSPGLADTEVEVQKGRASVEVLDIHKENNIRIKQDEASTKLLKNGLYEFDAGHSQVRVYRGKADVFVGDQKVSLGGEREVTLGTEGKLRAHDFDTRQYADDFYRWCGLRSAYLSEATIDAAHVYIAVGPGWYGPGWIGPGWYWSPWFGVWTFLPADGIYYSYFGWGFYSPIFVYRSPFFYYHYNHPHRFGEFHEPYGHGFEPPGGFRGGGPRGGFPGGGARPGGHH